MAITFTLRNSTGTSSVTYDLYSGTLYASAESWRVTINQGVATENISLSGSGTNTQLRTALTTLDDIKAQVIRYANDPNEDDPIYLYKVTDGEDTKRSLVLSMTITPLNAEGLSSLLENIGIKIALEIIHPDYWERVTTTSFGPVNTFANLGWTTPVKEIDSTLSVDGSLDARYDFTLGLDSGQYNRVWLGVRPRRLRQTSLGGVGGGSVHDPIFEIEEGTTGTDTSIQSESGASPSGSSSNNFYRCNFTSSASMVRRAYVTLDDHLLAYANDLSSWSGQYKVLLRYRLSSSPTTTVLFQLRYGMSGNSAMGAKRPVFLTNSGSWDLIEVGTLNIPVWGDFKYGDGAVGQSELVTGIQMEFWASLVTGAQGSSNFDLDAYVLVPNEHSMYAEDASMTAGTDHIEVRRGVNGKIYSYQYDSTLTNKPLRSLLVSHNNLYLPHGDSDIVIIPARSSSHLMTDLADLSVEYRRAVFNYIG